MNFMECTTCKRLVQVNNTGTCLGCQRGFCAEPQEDAWKAEEEGTPRNTLSELMEKQKELEDSIF